MSASLELMHMSPSDASVEPMLPVYENESLFEDGAGGDDIDSGSKSRRSATRDLENTDNSSSSRRSVNNNASSSAGNGVSYDHMPFVVMMKGLPFSVRDEEIVKFLEPQVKISRNQIQRMNRKNGLFMGNCFVNLRTSEEMDAVLAKHRKHIGSRYVEIFISSPEKRDRLIEENRPKRFEDDRRERSIEKRLGPGPVASNKKGNFFIYLKGLPFSVTESEIRKFLSGCEVLQDGILLGPPPTGFSRKDSNCNGDAFVELATEKDVSKAMAKHKQNIGSRYVEISKCSFEEVENYMERRRPPVHAPPPPPPRMDTGFGPPRLSMEREPLRREVMPVFMHQPPALSALDAHLEETHRKQMLMESRPAPPPIVMDPFSPVVVRPVDHRMDMIDQPMYPSARPLPQPSYERPLEVLPQREPPIPEFTSRPEREVEAGVPRNPDPLPPPQKVIPSPATIDEVTTYTVKLEGVPTDCKRQEVMEFLKPAKPTYVEFVKDSSGRVLEASAEFDSLQDLQVSMSKYRNTIRGRSIVVREILPEKDASPTRVLKEVSPPPVIRRRTRSRSRSPRRRERSPVSPRRRIGTRHRLMLCGIPPDCDEFDVQDFFAKVGRPASIEMDRDRDGRSRSVIVEFSSYDAMLDAERLDRLPMKHRPVELRRL